MPIDEAASSGVLWAMRRANQAVEAAKERRPHVRRLHDRHPHVLELHLTTAGELAVESADQAVTRLERRVVEIRGSQGSAQLRGLLETLTRELTP